MTIAKKSDSVYNLFVMEELLDVQEGLSFVDGDKDLYKILLEEFISSEKDFNKEAFLQGIQGQGLETAAKSVHKAKGAAFQLGAKAFGKKAQELEDILRKKIEKSPEALLAAAKDYLQALCRRTVADYDRRDEEYYRQQPYSHKQTFIYLSNHKKQESLTR